MIAMQIGKPRPALLRRALRAVLWGAVLAGLAIGVVSFLFNRITRMVPPSGSAPSFVIDSAGRRVTFGPSSLSWQGPSPREGTIWTLRLHGDPYRLGYAHGVLGNRLIVAADDHMFDLMQRFVPSSTSRWLLLSTVRWRYRGIAGYTPPDRRAEIAGLASAVFDCASRRGADLPASALLPRHARHHAGPRALAAARLLRLRRVRLRDHRRPPHHRPQLRLRRRRDLRPREGGAVLPARRARSRSPRSPGSAFAGVVTGINAEGIYISINAARTDDKGDEGMPVEILVARSSSRRTTSTRRSRW